MKKWSTKADRIVQREGTDKVERMADFATEIATRISKQPELLDKFKQPPPIPTLPGSPERDKQTTPQHPCGEEYVAVMELIQDAWQTGIDKTQECEDLKKRIQLMKEQQLESMVKIDMKRSFDLTWSECFGPEAFPTLKAHFKTRMGL